MSQALLQTLCHEHGAMRVVVRLLLEGALAKVSLSIKHGQGRDDIHIAGSIMKSSIVCSVEKS